MGPLSTLLVLALLAAPPGATAGDVRACERRVEQARVAQAEACVAELRTRGLPDDDLAALEARLAFVTGRLDDAASRLAALSDSPPVGTAELRRVVEAWRGRGVDYASREVLRSGGVLLRWRRPLDEAFAMLLPGRLERAVAHVAEFLGEPPVPPLEIVLAADRDDLAALAGLPLDEVRARNVIGTARYNRLVLLSPDAEPDGPSWTENLAHHVARHAITQRFGPDVPLWLAEGVALLLDGRFEAPGGRRWRLPAEGVVRRAMTFDTNRPARAPAGVDVGLLGALVVRGVLKAHGRPAVIDLLASGGTSLPRTQLVATLIDEWSRETRRPTFSGTSALRQQRDAGVERTLRLARLLLAGNHPHAALAELQKAHARERSVRTGLLLLPLAVQLGEWETAGALCDGLPEADAEGYVFRFFCGQLRFARQEYAAAAEAFERAVDFQPYDVPAHQALLQVREQLQESRAKLDQALILDVISARKEGP